MAKNELQAGHSRIGFAWDADRSDPYPAMLRDRDGRIELVIPIDDADDVLRRRYIGDLVTWGDDPDRSRFSYGSPVPILVCRRPRLRLPRRRAATSDRSACWRPYDNVRVPLRCRLCHLYGQSRCQFRAGERAQLRDRRARPLVRTSVCFRIRGLLPRQGRPRHHIDDSRATRDPPRGHYESKPHCRREVGNARRARAYVDRRSRSSPNHAQTPSRME